MPNTSVPAYAGGVPEIAVDITLPRSGIVLHVRTIKDGRTVLFGRGGGLR